MRRILWILFAFFALTVSAQAMAAEWRFALEEIKGSVQDAYAEHFKQLIEQKTHGAVKVAIYPYGTLGTSSQLTELVQNGAIQFAFASPGHLGAVVPETQVFSLHFLFSDNARVNERLFADSKPLYRILGRAYRDKSLQLMAIVPEGWMVWTGNRPLRTPADFKGFKMRTMVSPLLVKVYKAYGANPTPMPYSQVYSGLQLHMIDGQVNPVFAIEEMSFYEVQKDMTFAHQLPFVTTLVANPQFYDSLSPKMKKILTEVKKEMDAYIFKTERAFNARRLAIIRKKSDIRMIHLTPAQREAFRKLALPVRQEYVKMVGPRGQQVLDTVIRERDKAAAALGKGQGHSQAQ